MNQIKTLFLAEYQKRKSSYWWPVWIIAGLTALSLIAGLVAWITESPNIVMYGSDGSREGLRIGMYGVMFSFGITFALFMALNAQSSLNREKQLGSDLFFRSQPVCTWKITAVKYAIHVYGSSLLLLGLGIIFAVILSIVSVFFVDGFYLGQALYGTFLGWLTYLKVALVFGSLLFFFSAVFKNNALILGMAGLGILEGLFAIIEAIFRHTINMPNIFESLVGMVGTMGLDKIEEINMSIVMGDYRILFGLLFAGLCYAGATIIYKYRAKDV
ncbi:MAG: hypothetical protein DRP93_03210 [Candidatus Neomarinimicrobiota bacterium]|nr:MAG: hypothetical protein DRP93_03210 [Candidatus Neomarinimicrobiota bacterium]